MKLVYGRSAGSIFDVFNDRDSYLLSEVLDYFLRPAAQNTLVPYIKLEVDDETY